MSKLKQRELWVALAAPVAAMLAPKMGVPQEILSEVVVGIFALAGSYVVGRSAVKAGARVDR